MMYLHNIFQITKLYRWKRVQWFSGVRDGGGMTFKGQHMGDLCGDVKALYFDCMAGVA